MFMHSMRTEVPFAVILGLTACASMVESAPVTLTRSTSPDEAALKLERGAKISLPTGYTRELIAGSLWRRVGQVPQGDVYRPVGTVFTVEGRQVHEAYLVVRQRSLVGFYLPGESSYAPLPESIPLTLGEIK